MRHVEIALPGRYGPAALDLVLVLLGIFAGEQAERGRIAAQRQDALTGCAARHGGLAGGVGGDLLGELALAIFAQTGGPCPSQVESTNWKQPAALPVAALASRAEAAFLRRLGHQQAEIRRARLARLADLADDRGIDRLRQGGGGVLDAAMDPEARQNSVNQYEARRENIRNRLCKGR